MKMPVRWTMLLVLSMALVNLGPITDATASRGCSNASLRGRYGLHATGDVLGVGPFAAVGVFSFDGAGHLAGTLTARVNGNTVLDREPLTGTYRVTPDCQVSDTWSFASGETSQHESVIVDHGNGYFILNTTQGDPNVISAEARRLFPLLGGED
jgi:hypothetical protein